MLVSLSFVGKLAFALLLVVAILVSGWARAPRHAVPVGELRRLVLGALALYAAGLAALLTHHATLATLVFAGGVAVAALAAWLSRGQDQDDPPGGQPPVDDMPPPKSDPTGPPGWNWPQFERDFRAWAARRGQPTGRR